MFVLAASLLTSATGSSFALKETVSTGSSVRNPAVTAVTANDFTWNRAIVNNPNFAVFKDLTVTNYTYFPANEVDGILYGIFPNDKEVTAAFDTYVTSMGFNANAQAFPASLLFSFIKLRGID